MTQHLTETPSNTYQREYLSRQNENGVATTPQLPVLFALPIIPDNIYDVFKPLQAG